MYVVIVATSTDSRGNVVDSCNLTQSWLEWNKEGVTVCISMHSYGLKLKHCMSADPHAHTCYHYFTT